MRTLDSLDRIVDLAPALGAWVGQAACARLPDELAATFTAEAPEAHEVALATVVCNGCPVRQECAEYAARANARGLWGATWRGRRSSTAPAA